MWPSDPGPTPTLTRRAGPTEPRRPGPGSRRAGRGHSTPSFVCSRPQGPLTGRPPPTGRPPGPASPPPLAGPGQKMVQKKTAELQGFHRSFKVRAGSSWGRPGLDHTSGRWRDAEPAPQDTHWGSCQLPTLRLELPQPGVHCRGGGRCQQATVQSQAPWDLSGLSSRSPKPGWGPLHMCPLPTRARHVLVW